MVLRFAAGVAEDVAEFVFHPDPTVEPNEDGSKTVRFTAGGVEEMCWHLVTWGTAVTVERPARLRRRLFADACRARTTVSRNECPHPRWTNSVRSR